MSRDIVIDLGILLAAVLMALLGCTAPLQGPPVELATVLAPEPVTPPPTPLPPVPQPTPGPEPGAREFRAWVPREVSVGGDTIEGHWRIMSTEPPPVERLEPQILVPRAPKTIYGPKAQAPAERQPLTPPLLQGLPIPVLPSGAPGGVPFGTPAASRALQLPMMPQLLGGQAP